MKRIDVLLSRCSKGGVEPKQIKKNEKIVGTARVKKKSVHARRLFSGISMGYILKCLD